jgi:hypothetical protein
LELLAFTVPFCYILLWVPLGTLATFFNWEVSTEFQLGFQWGFAEVLRWELSNWGFSGFQLGCSWSCNYRVSVGFQTRRVSSGRFQLGFQLGGFNLVSGELYEPFNTTEPFRFFAKLLMGFCMVRGFIIFYFLRNTFKHFSSFILY